MRIVLRDLERLHERGVDAVQDRFPVLGAPPFSNGDTDNGHELLLPGVRASDFRRACHSGQRDDDAIRVEVDFIVDFMEKPDRLSWSHWGEPGTDQDESRAGSSSGS